MSRVFVYVFIGSLFSMIALFLKGRVHAQGITTDGCPNTSGILTICFFDPFMNCIAENQCPYGYKCCPYGCGHQCLAVANSLQHPAISCRLAFIRKKATVSSENCPTRGSCPARRIRNSVSCLNDATCKANEKCCYRYCIVVRPFWVPVL